MCCACPEECPTVDSLAVDRPEGCEDWIDFHSLAPRPTHSNRGGLGPDHDKPRELRYYGVGRLPNGVIYDL
eukprot:4731795-Pyramimonas_sp.AAC.1